MTMDSWATSVARPLIFDAGLVVAGPFCVSFTFIAGIVMTNVVIAILLDKYLTATAELLESKRRAKAAKNAAKAQRRLARRAARQSFRSPPEISSRGSPPARMGSVGTDLDESLSSVSSSSSEDGGSKKLDKDDLISMVAEARRAAARRGRAASRAPRAAHAAGALTATTAAAHALRSPPACRSALATH